MSGDESAGMNAGAGPMPLVHLEYRGASASSVPGLGDPGPRRLAIEAPLVGDVAALWVADTGAAYRLRMTAGGRLLLVPDGQRDL